MNALLDDVRRRFGATPRKLNSFTRWRLRANLPNWIASEDELMEIFRRQDDLLNDGEIVWGVLVQANGDLYKRGEVDYPALIIYAEVDSAEYPEPRLGPDAPR